MLKKHAHAILITTITDNHGSHRIKNTLSPDTEVEIINQHLASSENTEIIVYGLNCADTSVFNKYEQLISFGFTNVFIYCGGIFEWMLLQDVYGADTFHINHAVDDMLKYK
jgi:hypothetical protein